MEMNDKQQQNKKMLFLCERERQKVTVISIYSLSEQVLDDKITKKKEEMGQVKVSDE